jgi:chromosome partitioning protein
MFPWALRFGVFSMAILLFVNIKGGVAKTTNSVAVAECFAAQGFETLVIDADHQCAASELLLGETRLLKAERRKKTLHDLLARMLDVEFDAEETRHYVEKKGSNINEGRDRVDVLPCSIRIDDFQSSMAKARRGFQSPEEFQAVYRRRKNGLRKWINTFYDFTIIDCPPSLAIQVKTLITMGDGFIVPSLPDRLSVRSSIWLRDRVRRANVKTRGLGTLWSMHRVQNAMHRKTIEAAGRGVYPYSELVQPFHTVIPNAAAIAQATEPGVTWETFTEKYTAKFAALYRDVCKEIIDRLAEPPSETDLKQLNVHQLWLD